MAKTVGKVGIWNRALDRIGETEPIEDEDEDRMAADVCRRHYDDCLLEVLESTPWPFATKQSALTSPTGVTRTGWDYIYTLPTDCAYPLALLDEDQRIGLMNADERVPFEIMSDDAGVWRILCCDVASDEFEVLEYVATPTSTASNDTTGGGINGWPRTFADAVIWRLAAELALAIKKDRQMYIGCMQSYMLSLSNARADQFNSKHPDPEPDPPSVAARS